jgi:hypothetical protein
MLESKILDIWVPAFAGTTRVSLTSPGRNDEMLGSRAVERRPTP